MNYKKYLVKDTDQFDVYNFPKLSDDMNMVTTSIKELPSSFSSEILVSFLRDHSIKMEWIKANPELAGLVSAGALPTANFEALFESSRGNTLFQDQLEAYIKLSLAS